MHRTILAAVLLVTMTWGSAVAVATPDPSAEAPADDRPLPATVSPMGQDLARAPLEASDEAEALGQQLAADPATSVEDRLGTGLEAVHDGDVDARMAPPASLTTELVLAHAADGDPLDPAEVRNLQTQVEDLPAGVAEALAWLVKGARLSEAVRPDVAAQVDDEALSVLAEDRFPGDDVEAASTDAAQLLSEDEASNLAAHEAAMDPVGLDRVLTAHLTMAAAVDGATAALQGVDGAGTATAASQPGDVFNASTPYGPIYVSGSDDTVYPAGLEALATVDLGGEDRYENRAGAVNADVLDLLGANPFDPSDVADRVQRSHNASVSIDLQGDDEYVHQGPGAQGYGGFGGFGALVDLAGDDTYDSGALAQGAGLVAGAGVLVDATGQDGFAVDQQGQGYAQDSGAGLLVSGAGNDTYEAQIVAQGTGFVGGLFGGLVDLEGSETYRCTGVADFSSVLIPVDVGRPGSTCQATGFGGAGVLVDAVGDDAYETASSFRNVALLGAGLHADLSGSDTFTSGEWSNGVGVLGASVLVSAGTGSDVLVSTQDEGPWVDVYVGANGEGYNGVGVVDVGGGDDVVSHDVDKGLWLTQYACGVGCTHEGGVGVLASAVGDDVYTTEVGQGASVGGVAVLQDEAGDDTYERRYDSIRTQGYAEYGTAPADLLLGTCTLGLLQDGSGQDTYSNPVTDFGQRGDDEAWGQGDYGRGIDGAGGTAAYASNHLVPDAQDVLTRQACQQVVDI